MAGILPSIESICECLIDGEISLRQAQYWLGLHAQHHPCPDKAIRHKGKCEICGGIGGHAMECTVSG